MLTALGALVVRRKYIVLATWAVVILAALPFFPRADEFLKPGGFSNESFPSVKARQVLQERLELTTLTVDFVFSHPDWSPFDPRFSGAVDNAVAGLIDYDEISYVVTQLDDPQRASSTSNTAHVSAGLKLELEESLDFLEIVTEHVDPGPLDLIITGGPALYRDISLASERDLRRGETVAFPIATLALLLVFGTLVAAILPAAVGGGGVLVGVAIVFFMSQGIDMSVFALNIVSLLGIGIGIDYSLFYTSRFQEELRKGKTVDDAVLGAHSHAGKAILFSAVTSLIGLLSLITFDVMMLRSVGIGAVAVISAALIAALTLMPAILAVLGERVNRFRIGPDWSRRGSFWEPLSKWVMKRPWLVLIPTSTVLILLAVPALSMRLGTVDATILPDSLESRQGFDVLREEFGFALQTIIPVAYTFGELGGDLDDASERTNPFSRENLDRAYDIGRELERLEGVSAVTSIVNLDPTFGPDQYELLYTHPESITDVAAARIVEESVRPGAILFLVHSDLHPFWPETRQLVADIRALIPPDGELHVSGGASEITDIINTLYGKFPYIVAAVLIITYLSLMLLFRSVILPLKAVALNVLSILASYGALVFVFQQGHFSGVLNFEAMGVIEATLPILLFAIIFGLSMDYEIFLLSRVAEAYDRTGDNEASVAEGLQRSGLIITGAASILIVVAGSFVLADVVVVKAIGLGLAIAVFVDVTLVRALVAPAIMRIAGPWNWWLPGWLDRILPEVKRVD
ncbi:MAG: MMPL family transporter [Chloroflexi bacterium]|jgi:RND superfamily putative drug exporter|nr:MMPL family transporter [Chloroflexota bacterium]MBT5627006.1 MMPL family transporter [Chloroflexota bacterium]